MKEIDLESQLKIKKNEYKMLNDSFIDLIDKNGNQTSINELKKAIESTMDDIYNISTNIQANQINRHIMERAVATKNKIENMEKVNLREKYGELYEHLCSAQYIANEIGDSNANSIKEIRVDIGDKLLKQHGY